MEVSAKGCDGEEYCWCSKFFPEVGTVNVVDLSGIVCDDFLRGITDS